MTIKQKSPTFGSFIHPCLGEVRRDRQSIAGSIITPITISGKGSHYPTNTRVQKDMTNKSDISRKHMRNNKIYMCQHEVSTVSM
ncbi:hypothetical protein GW17_00052841 [Ensete ventricosum]|nr:hypothetical protein GW17_00052841 [Ensete ventricosum]